MRRLVIGTAGHIDHGKTTLLKALTGIDCDRWSEEKERGITIDLGFAHLEDGKGDDALQIGFVDVPGHERFLHNALAGLGGIRLMLLVVAADEGVKPQTREHVDICSLLKIPHAVVVLTKKDAVDEELLELAQLEIEEYLEATPFAGSPVVAVSSTAGDGIDELRALLIAKARELVDTGKDTAEEDTAQSGGEQPVRLPLDRAFQLKGLGAVVTGTLISGRIEAGQAFDVLPGGHRAKVRSLQVHGENRPRAEAGERTAVQITGVDLSALARGQQLVTPDTFGATKSLCARFTLLEDAPEPFTTFMPIRYHGYAAEVIGKLRPLGGSALEPGQTGLVEIRLAEPVVAVRGDRFIARRPSPATTLGGGVILDPQWRRRRGSRLAPALRQVVDRASVLDLWVREANERGVTARELLPRRGGTLEALVRDLDARVQEGKLLRVESGRGTRWIAPEACERVIERARRVLKRYFAENRLAGGMPKAQLIERTLPRRAVDLADVYMQWLEAAKVLIRDGNQVNVPGREAKLTGEESKLATDLLRAVQAEGLTPPSPLEMAHRLGAKQQILDGVMAYLLEQGKLVRLPSGLVLAASEVEGLKEKLLASETWQQFSVTAFKDHFGLSRKWAIPLLEHLDSVGFTRRVGDERQLVRR